jgi:hypothetical protein
MQLLILNMGYLSDATLNGDRPKDLQINRSSLYETSRPFARYARGRRRAAASLFSE